MKYKTLTNSKPEALDNLVNEYLADGWKLHGNPYQFNHNMCQPVTKGEYVRPARLKEKANVKSISKSD